VVLQRVVDHGLSSGSSAELNQALLLFLLVVSVLAVAVAARVYLVNWLGERVVADIRKAVFAQVLRLEPAFFEVTRTGEVISRLTTDTSLLQAALEQLMQNRTTLIIAHRLATVRKVDRIVVLDALMAEGGLYARLAALQFRDAVGV